MRSDRDLVGALPRLRRYALALTREHESAGDLVQQTALRALAAPRRPSGPNELLPWLLTIARNIFIDERRRAARRAVVPPDMQVASDGDDGLRAVAIRQALARLDADCLAVIELVDVQGHSYREAADILAIPLGTVMSRISRARRRLIADLTSDGDGT